MKRKMAGCVQKMRAGKNGQLQLEAIICLAAFIAILGMLLAALNQAGMEANNAMEALGANSRAELCCLAADISYAGGIGEIRGETHCTAEGTMAKSGAGANEKDCESIAPEIRIVQEGKKSRLEVTLNAHYR
jgi:hypothetical protein